MSISSQNIFVRAAKIYFTFTFQTTAALMTKTGRVMRVAMKQHITHMILIY